VSVDLNCQTGKWAEIVQEKKPPSFSDHMQKAYEKAQSDNLIKTIDDSFVFKIALDAAEEYISNNSTESQSR